MGVGRTAGRGMPGGAAEAARSSRTATQPPLPRRTPVWSWPPPPMSRGAQPRNPLLLPLALSGAHAARGFGKAGAEGIRGEEHR
eukprot:scaffold14357_cov101-Isochrysis_galbana.AAC.2